MPGSPDFQDYPQWLGPNLLPAYVQTFPVGHTKSGALPLTSYRAAQLRIAPTVGAGTVTLNWYDTAAETDLVGADHWNVNVTTGLTVIVPAKGPFADLDFNNTSGAPATAATLLAGTNAGAGQLDYPVTRCKAAAVAQAVPAATTSVFALPHIRPGLGWLSAQAADAAGELSASVVTLTAAGAVLDTLANFGVLPNATWLNSQAPLTDEICALAVTNADAVNPHTFSGWLTATVR